MKETQRKRPKGLWATSIVAIIFGLMTLKEGGLTLFGPPQYAEAAGNYVSFVLWFNFIAGFFYIIAGACIFMQRQRGARLAMVIALLTLLVFAALGVHIATGGAFETHTLIAMTLRSLVWSAIAVYAYRTLLFGKPAAGQQETAVE